MIVAPTTARPDERKPGPSGGWSVFVIVEGLCFLSTDEKGQGFDKLSLNGF